MDRRLDLEKVLNYVFETVCSTPLANDICDLEAVKIPSTDSSGIGAIKNVGAKVQLHYAGDKLTASA